MPIYQRDGSPNWYISLTQANGKRLQKSTGTVVKKEAEELEKCLAAQIWREKKLGEKPKMLWMEACMRWTSEKSGKKSFSDDLSKFKWFDTYLRSKTLNEIDKELTEYLISEKLREGAKPATVNRYMALLKSILKIAKEEWEVIDAYPKIRLLKENNERSRILTEHKLKRLLEELPDHTRVMALFTLCTGLRMSNVTNLKWAQVRLDQDVCIVDGSETKSGRSVSIPLNTHAKKIIEDQIGIHGEYVFTYNGRPIKAVNTRAFRSAVKRAGIEDFRWHDLRHMWATAHAEAGTPMHVLQELGNWQSSAMVSRYAHLSSDHLKKHANSLPSLEI